MDVNTCYPDNAMKRAFFITPVIGLFVFALSAFAPTDPGTSAPEGRGLYEANCARCHGMDGTKGKWGARDLSQSRMIDPAIVAQIRSGKGIMPAFGSKLSEQEITEVLGYVKTLRSPEQGHGQ
jgi:mono/diheme cytochrome c family protein